MVRRGMLLLLALCVPATALGQEVGDVEDLGDLELEAIEDLEVGLDDEFALLAEEDVVVSATRYARRIGASPSAVTVITRAQIEASGLQDVHDLLRLVPGFDVHLATPAYPIIGARAGTTEASNLMVVLIDGREVALEVLGTPLLSGLAITVDDIERIEVIRGPGSTLYGANAYQGVVSITTRTPPEDFGLASSVRVGTHGSLLANARLAWTWDEWRAQASGGFDKLNSFYETGAERLTWRGRLLAEGPTPGEGTLTLDAGVSNLTGASYTGIGPQIIRLFLNPYARARWTAGNLVVEAWGNVFESRNDLDLGARLVEADGSTTELLELLPSDGGERFSLSAATVDLGAHYRFDWELFEGGANVLVVGSNVRYTHQASNGSVSDCPFPFTDVRDCETDPYREARFGAFAQNETFIGDWLTLTLGLRADLNTLIRQPLALSPRAAVVWHPAEGHDVRLSYGRAYRKPTILEAASSLRVDGVYPVAEVGDRVEEIFATQIGNPNIKPEILEALELGYRASLLDGALTLSADLWAYRATDAIYFQVDFIEYRFGVPVIKEDAIIQFQNDEETADDVGFELGATLRPLSWVTLGAAYAFRESLDLERPFNPSHKVDAWAQVGTLAGPRAWLHVDWLSRYYTNVVNPQSAIAGAVRQDHGGRIRLSVTAAWRHPLRDGGFIEGGVTGLDLVAGVESLGGGRRREYAGCPGQDCPDGVEAFVGEPLDRILTVFLRGEM